VAPTQAQPMSPESQGAATQPAPTLPEGQGTGGYQPPPEGTPGPAGPPSDNGKGFIPEADGPSMQPGEMGNLPTERARGAGPAPGQPAGPATTPGVGPEGPAPAGGDEVPPTQRSAGTPAAPMSPESQVAPTVPAGQPAGPATLPGLGPEGPAPATIPG